MAFTTVLKPLTRDKTMELWSDQKIKPGGLWKSEIQQYLKSAKLALLLVSPYFLASDFIADHELPPLLARAQAEGVKILWIAVSASLYHSSDLAQYQSLNDPAKPLDSLSPSALNRELVSIAESIKDALS